MKTPKLINADDLYKRFEEAEWYDTRDRDFIAEKLLLSQPEVSEIGHTSDKPCSDYNCSDCIERVDEKA